MRVLEVCPYDLDVPGGVQRQAGALAHALSQLGVSVDLVGPGQGGLGRSVRVPANGSVAPIGWDLRMVRSLWRAMRDATVVHLHEPLVPLVGPMTIALARRASIPVIATGHRAGMPRGVGRALLAGVGRVGARGIHVATAVSPSAAMVARAWAPGPIEIIPNGLNLPEAVPDDQARRPGSVVFVGRLEERKGIRVLLAALPMLVDSVSSVVIVGDGPLAPLVRRAAERWPGWLTWRGRVDDATLDRAYREAEVLVAPSLGGESFGVVLLEAMARGAVVVASAIEGYRPVVADAGVLVEPNDPSALAGAIRSILEDRNRRRALIARGYERANAHDISSIARRYLELVERVIREGSVT